MKNFFYLFSLVLLVSCSSAVKEESTEVVAKIYPIHPKPQDEKYMLYNKKYVFSFMDLDGNQYVTSWIGLAGDEYNGERFINITKKCSQQTHIFYPRDLMSLTHVLESELAYKYIVTCISKEGYKLENSRAHNPEEVVVLIGKQYDAFGKSVKAGGRISIVSKGLEVSDILPFAQECYKESSKKYQQGEVSNLIYINMEPVVNGFASCMRSKSFKVIEMEN